MSAPTFQPLLQLLHQALEPNGHFILAEPNRPIARDFLRLLRDRGFQYTRTTERVEVGGEVIRSVHLSWWAQAGVPRAQALMSRS